MHASRVGMKCCNHSNNIIASFSYFRRMWTRPAPNTFRQFLSCVDFVDRRSLVGKTVVFSVRDTRRTCDMGRYDVHGKSGKIRFHLPIHKAGQVYFNSLS